MFYNRPDPNARSMKRIKTPPASPTAGGILARLMRMIFINRRIMSEEGVLLDGWPVCLDAYIRLPEHSNLVTIRERQSKRAGVQKELLKSEISWKVFLKGLKVARIKNPKIVIEYDVNGKTQVVQVSLADLLDSNVSLEGDD